MEPEAKYALVGAVIIFLCGLLVWAVFWLSDISEQDQSAYYTIYFREHSLAGLQQDSDVTMKGIKVGVVDSFEISRQDIERVKVVIRLRGDTPIKTDTRAVINRNLLTGLAFIELASSSRQSKYLTEVRAGEEYPVIPEGQTELQAIANNLPEFLGHASELVARASEFFSKENMESVTEILSNLKQASATLAKNDQKLTTIIGNLDALSGKLVPVAESMTKVSKAIDEDFDTVYAEFRETIAALKGASVSLETGITEISGSISGAADVLSLELSSFTQEMRQAAQTVSTTAGNYEDPAKILSGPSSASLGPGEHSLLPEGGK